MLSTHFITFILKERNVLFNETYMVKDHSASEETLRRRHYIGYRLAARDLLYVPSYRRDSTYHALCYTSRGALAGVRNS